MAAGLMSTFVTNAAGRLAPNSVNGRDVIPYRGVGQHRPTGHRAGPQLRSCADFPPGGDKRVASLVQALKRASLASGMTVSTHHHLRNGDRVAIQLFAAARELGVRDLVWFPSAVFPCHAELIPYLQDGTISRIEGSLNGPVGSFASSGGMEGMAVLRSHGGRYRSLQDGDIRVDIAVIAAPTSDSFGNCTGDRGPSACGSLGFAVADAQFAEHVIVITDNLVEFPCLPMQIAGNSVDQVVCVDSIGDPGQIVSGTTAITRSPERRLIGEMVAAFARDSGILRPGFSFQAGAGGISLAATSYIGQLMRERDVRASFIRGGSTAAIVELLEAGYAGAILDGQTFDLEGVRSIRENPNHVMTTPFNSYNYHGKGNFASMVDLAILGATEVDLDFNANVVTHSDGTMRHGIGGWQDALFARCTVLAVPLFRNRIPVIRDRVTTLCGPGELIDVVITERGMAINPRRGELLDSLRGSRLPIRTLEDLKAEAETVCGVPKPPVLSDDVVGVVTWVDGTILDTTRRATPDWNPNEAEE